MPDWKPERKRSNNIKWGYVVDPHDPQQIIPVPEMEKLMDQAFKYIRSGQYSYRDVAEWLSKAGNRKISHIALRNNHFMVEVRKKRHEAYVKRRNATATTDEEGDGSRIRTEPNSSQSAEEAQGTVREGEHNEQTMAD